MEADDYNQDQDVGHPHQDRQSPRQQRLVDDVLKPPVGDDRRQGKKSEDGRGPRGALLRWCLPDEEDAVSPAPSKARYVSLRSQSVVKMLKGPLRLLIVHDLV